MMNPVRTSIPQADGTDRYVVIEPIIEKQGERGWRSTGEYKIYKDEFSDETYLLSEPAMFGEVNDDLTDKQDPDYLGTLFFKNGVVTKYERQVLSTVEQAYMAVFIESYREPDLI